MNTYIPRVTDTLLTEALTFAGAVTIDGARAVGKTESARRLAKSELRLDSSDPLAVLSREQPSLALKGQTPRLLDEWQLVPALWNEVRHAVDARGEVGQFLLSGSAAPDATPLRHSGAGRFARVRMRTMTFWETGHSTGRVSLVELLRGELPEVTESELGFEGVVQRIVGGGWPGWCSLEVTQSQQRTLAYASDLAEHDFPALAGSGRNPLRFSGFLRSLAALVAQPSSFAAMRRHMNEVVQTPAGDQLIPVLVDFALRMYVLENQPAWAPKLRSRTTPTQTPKRHLVDPSLAAALLGAGTERLLLERRTLGHLFESQVTHDCSVYAEAARARGVFHYRDTKGRDEIDIVVEGADGAWLAIEVKLGQNSVDQAAQGLLRVTAKFERAPAACIVVIPNGVAHRRPDGVYVIPLTVLGP